MLTVKGIAKATGYTYNITEQGTGGSGTAVSNILNKTTRPDFASFYGDGIQLLDDKQKFHNSKKYSGRYVDCATGVGATTFTITCNKNFKNIAIEFYNHATESFDITSNGTKLETLFVGDDNVAETDLSQYNVSEITIENIQTYNTNDYTLISSIMLYPNIIYHDIDGMNIVEEINILSDDLPSNSLEFTTFTDGNINEQGGSVLYVWNNTQFLGKYTLDEYERIGDKVYRIFAFDDIMKLNDITYYRFPETVSQNYDLFNAFNNSTGDFAGIISIDTSAIPSFTRDEYIPYGVEPIVTYRQYLADLCFASGLMIFHSKMSGVKPKPIPTTITSELKSDRILGEATVIENTKYSSANLEMPYQLSGGSRASRTIPASTGKRATFYFDEPIVYFGVTSGTATVHGAGQNYIDFTPRSTAMGGIAVETSPLFCAYSQKTINNSLISDGDIIDFDTDISVMSRSLSYDFIDRVADIRKFIRSRFTVQATVIVKDEEVGDLITIETPYNGTIKGIITKMEYTPDVDTVANISVYEWGN